MDRAQEIAWAAGLFEGEGTFGFRPLIRGGRAPADLRLGMTDRDTVEAFAEIVRCGTIRTQSRTHKGHQDLHIWVVSGMESIAQVIDLFLPYLKSRRRNAAEEALAYIRNTDRNRRELQLGATCVNGHVMTEETLRVDLKWYNQCLICRRATRERYKKKVAKTVVPA